MRCNFSIRRISPIPVRKLVRRSRAQFPAAAGWLARLTLILAALILAAPAPHRASVERATPTSAGTPRQTTSDDEHARLRQMIAGHEWDQVAEALPVALAHHPDDAELNYWQGLLLGADNPAAENYLRHASASPSFQARAQAALGALARHANDRPAERWIGFGVALVGLGEWPWAERAFDQALADDPLHAVALAYRGYAKDQQGGDGLRDIESAQALAPREPVGYYFAGLHWRAAGDHAASERAFLDAHWLDPTNPAFAAEVGGALELQGAYTDAALWYRMAVELAPDDPSWYALLARFYVESGYRPDEEDHTFIEDAAARFPDHADLAVSYGWALSLRGEHARAYDVLNHAVSLASDSVRARYYFGLVLEKLGDRGAAADSLWFVLDTAEAGGLYSLGAARALERLGFPVTPPAQ